MHEPLPTKTDNSVSGSTIPDFGRCLPSRCLAKSPSGLSRKRVLAKRCLVMDYSDFQASCHIIIIIIITTTTTALLGTFAVKHLC
jgi:hypothetical protein